MDCGHTWGAMRSRSCTPPSRPVSATPARAAGPSMRRSVSGRATVTCGQASRSGSAPRRACRRFCAADVPAPRCCELAQTGRQARRGRRARRNHGARSDPPDRRDAESRTLAALEIPSPSRVRLDDLLQELLDRVGEVVASRERLSSLLQAVVGIGSDLDLRSTLYRIVKAACELVGARYG